MAAEEEEDQILQLFDLYWFKSQILTAQQTTFKDGVYQYKRASSLHHDHMRSFSYRSFLSSKGTHSPNSVLAMLMLESMQGEEKRRDDHHQVNGFRVSRSIAELEFEEIRGFMDLGFEFSEEDKRSPRLVSILPGLKRLGRRKNGDDGEDVEAVSRPYLSEAWREEETSLLMSTMKNWKTLSTSNEADMKQLLRMWARAVASAVQWHGR